MWMSKPAVVDYLARLSFPRVVRPEQPSGELVGIEPNLYVYPSISCIHTLNLTWKFISSLSVYGKEVMMIRCGYGYRSYSG